MFFKQKKNIQTFPINLKNFSMFFFSFQNCVIFKFSFCRPYKQFWYGQSIKKFVIYVGSTNTITITTICLRTIMKAYNLMCISSIINGKNDRSKNTIARKITIFPKALGSVKWWIIQNYIGWTILYNFQNF